MLGCLCAAATAAIVFFCVGFAAETSRTLSPFFLGGLGSNDLRVLLFASFQMLSVGVAAVIPLGSGADRWRLSAICLSTALLAGVTFPLFSRFALDAGWLAQLGQSYGFGRGFLDGGCGTTQTVGGLTALSISWVLGPRRGKYGKQGRSFAIPGHDAVLVLCGCLLGWIGWIGLNASGAVLFTGTTPIALVFTAALTTINTTLAASAGALAAAVITRYRFGRPDASLIANGWFCGLVSSGAGSSFFAPAEAAATGLVAGIIVVFAVELLESRWLIDDPSGAISVHAGGGVWGLLAAGLLGRVGGQWLAQLVGIATLVGFVLPMTYALNALLNRLYQQRVSTAAEMQGLDLHELGAGAYPEFVIHSEDPSGRLR